MKNKLLTGLLLGATLAAASSAAQSQARVTVAPAKETAGRLLHGLTLEAALGDFPILIKLDGIEQPLVGQAHFQAPGRAAITVVSFGNVKVSGYVVSPKDRKTGLPVRCLKSRAFHNGKECIVGDVDEGEKVSVIFPDGLDIISQR